MQYPPTELVLDANGNVYHLGLSKENVADTILLVGDQDRVDLIASLFDTLEHASQHREFVCKTGTYNGKRITALSTGIGTDNIDITINELDAIHNINSKERKDNAKFKSLNLQSALKRRLLKRLKPLPHRLLKFIPRFHPEPSTFPWIPILDLANL